MRESFVSALQLYSLGRVHRILASKSTCYIWLFRYSMYWGGEEREKKLKSMNKRSVIQLLRKPTAQHTGANYKHCNGYDSTFIWKRIIWGFWSWVPTSSSWAAINTFVSLIETFLHTLTLLYWAIPTNTEVIQKIIFFEKFRSQGLKNDDDRYIP